MKVKDLILELAAFDLEADVLVWDDSDTDNERVLDSVHSYSNSPEPCLMAGKVHK